MRQWLFPLALSFATYFLVVSAYRLYTGGDVDKSSFVAPSSPLVYEPLCKTVDSIVPYGHSYVTNVVTVVTDYGVIKVDSLGAVVSSLEYIRKSKTGDMIFSTLSFSDNENYAQKAFLIGQENATSVNYELIDTQDDAHAMMLKYVVHSPEGMIEKIFTIYKHLCKINLKITAIPVHEKGMKLRLFMPSPEMGEVVEGDYCGAVIVDKKNSFIKKRMNALDDQSGYLAPRMFGSDNKYFVNALVADSNHFAARAYYSIDNGKLISIFESAHITEKTSWLLDFYMGPKDVHVMHPVSPLLEKTLDYGMLSFFTKLLLYALETCYEFLGNFGWAIIALTFLLKLLLLPFTLKGEATMKKVKEQQKQLALIDQKYKHDPKALAEAKEQLMREQGLSTLGGCLPMLLQPIVFMSLSGAINNSIALHKAPFVWWIRDLSLPDSHYILPIIMFFVLLFSILMNAEKLNAKKTIGITLAVFLGVAFMGSMMSAGLALFICVSMMLHVIQTAVQKAYKL